MRHQPYESQWRVCYLLGQVGEVLGLPSGEEVDTKQIGGKEEDVQEDKGADQVLPADDHTHSFIVSDHCHVSR